MNKTQLIQTLAERAQITRTQATRVVDALFGDDGIIAEALSRGDKVQITGFGNFEVRERRARTGRNPRTGATIKIGPSKTAAFRAGKALKTKIAGRRGK